MSEDVDLTFGIPKPVQGLKGVKAVHRKYKGTMYLSTLTSKSGAVYLGSFFTPDQAAERWDLAKRLFFILTGDAAKLVEREQYNDPDAAAKWNDTAKIKEKINDPAVCEKIEKSAAAYVAGGKKTAGWAPRMTRMEFTERLMILEKQMERALGTLELYRQRISKLEGKDESKTVDTTNTP